MAIPGEGWMSENPQKEKYATRRENYFHLQTTILVYLFFFTFFEKRASQIFQMIRL